MKPIARDQYRITSVKVLGRGKLRLKYINGYWVEVDLRDLADRGGQLAKLADDAFLARYKLREFGMYLDWPGEIGLDAETLWERGQRVVGEEELSIDGLGRPRIGMPKKK
jgi:hypothetical protein